MQGQPSKQSYERGVSLPAWMHSVLWSLVRKPERCAICRSHNMGPRSCCTQCMHVRKCLALTCCATRWKRVSVQGVLGTLQDGEGAEVVSVSVWRTNQNGVLEPWADFKLSVDTSKPAETITVRGSEGGGSATGSRSRLKVGTPRGWCDVRCCHLGLPV